MRDENEERRDLRTSQMVGFSIKELFDQLREGIERIDHKLDNKADSIEVAALNSRIAYFESQEPIRQQLIADFLEIKRTVQRNENRLEGMHSVEKYKRYIVASIGAVLLNVVVQIVAQVLRLVA